MRRSPAALALFTVVLLGLAGASTAFVTLDKTVTVSVDGDARTVHTFAGTVGEVLHRIGVGVGPHDVVAPDERAPVHDGSHVEVRRGRPLALTLDGERRTVWVTSRTVAGALDELGLDGRGVWLSASRSLAIPRRGLDMAVRLPQQVTVLVDGHRYERTTTAPTVAALLAEAGVRLDTDDTVSVPLSAYPLDGLVVSVTRVDKKTIRETVPIPFRTVNRPDPNLYKGQSQVVQAGAPGARYEVTVNVYKNGKLVYRKRVTEQVTQQPTDRIVAVGTKARPAYAPSSDGLDWPALARCESGGNPRAVSANGAYRGLYQFDLGTWHAVGGAGDPIDASSSEQTYRAQILYRERGTSPWPVCGHALYS